MDTMDAVKKEIRLGAVGVGKGFSWATVNAHGPLRFECGTTDLSGQAPFQLSNARQAVLGLPADRMAFRRTALPFTKIERIQAVIAQEAMDALLDKPDDVHFALCCSSEGKRSDILYAVSDKPLLKESKARFEKSFAVPPGAMVVSELGAWPLLADLDLLPHDHAALVIDASATPISLYVINHDTALTVRLVSKQAEQAGSEALLEELAWLSPWQPVVLVLALATFIGIFQQGWLYYFMQKEAADAQKKIEAAFREALPNVPVIIDARKQLQQALQGASLSVPGAGATLNHWLAILQLKTPANLNVEWQHLHYANSAIEILGEVSSYEELSQLQAELSGAEGLNKIDVEDARLITKKNRVQFKLKIS